MAVDSPGGLVNFIMNLLFQEKNMGITVNDLTNVTVLGDGSQRLAALAAGEVDVGSVDLFELPDLQKQIGADAVTTPQRHRCRYGFRGEHLLRQEVVARRQHGPRRPVLRDNPVLEPSPGV